MNYRETPTREGLTSDEKELATLVTLSYRYSQGSNELQGYLLKWLFQNGYITPKMLPTDMPAVIASIMPPEKHTITSHDGISMELRHQWRALKSLDSTAPESEAEYLEKIVQYTIQRDLTFMAEAGRPGRNHNEMQTSDSPSDPYASFTRKYIIQQHQTGHPAYNRMFQEASGHIAQVNPENSINRSLQQLEWSWESHHAGETFFNPVSTPPLQ